MKDLEPVRAEMRDLLRINGLRATSPRMAVLVTLHEHRAPMNHEQVMDQLPEGAFDRATVWRILADLAESGLLRRMDLGDRIWRYELIDACRPVAGDHAHFLCDNCGVVRCLPPLELTTPSGQLPPILQGAQLRLRISGSCGDCVGPGGQVTS